MVAKVKTKRKAALKAKAVGKRSGGSQTSGAKRAPSAPRPSSSKTKNQARNVLGPQSSQKRRRESLRKLLLAKREEILREIKEDLGQSLTSDQQRRLESGMDSGDHALMDLERELGISLLEMRNRKRQLIDEALIRVEDGTYGVCAECGVEISEKRLEAVPFARLCVECQSREELLEKIEKEEERE